MNFQSNGLAVGVAVPLEGEDLGGEVLQVLDVVKREQLALDDGEDTSTWFSQEACTRR